MTLARQIEFNPGNWSSWEIWNWYIPNWVSNETTNNHWCSWRQWDSNWEWMTLWAWIAWSDCILIDWTKTNRNRLKLYNSEYIYDMAWNIQEYVNWANTIDWSTNSNIDFNICWGWGGSGWSRYSFKNWPLDSRYQCELSNAYLGEFWPIISTLNASNGVWNIYSHGTSFDAPALAYGADAWDTSLAWVFGVTWMIYTSTVWGGLGFRCTYIKE